MPECVYNIYMCALGINVLYCSTLCSGGTLLILNFLPKTNISWNAPSEIGLTRTFFTMSLFNYNDAVARQLIIENES